MSWHLNSAFPRFPSLLASIPQMRRRRGYLDRRTRRLARFSRTPHPTSPEGCCRRVPKGLAAPCYPDNHVECGSIYSHTPSTLKAPISILAACLLLLPGSAIAAPAHGIAMHGDPAEPADFAHFPYANPDAPRGGRLVLAKRGSFDSLNPLIVRGESAEGVRDYVYESLMARANDEPITVDDVIFSFELLRDHGRPNHRSYYQKVTRVERTGDRKVKFTFDGSGNREMPLIMGLMPVLPRHLIDAETFEKTSLAPPVGSGPYLVSEVKPGASITYKRNPNYWGAKLPVNRGLYN